MLRVIFRKFLTLLCLISIGLLSSCATIPAADESVVADESAEIDDMAESEDAENTGDGEDATNAIDVADGTDTTDGESDVTGDGVTGDLATADENADVSTASDASATTTEETTSTTTPDTTSTPTTETETTGTETTEPESAPTPTVTACSFLDTYSSSTSGTNIGGALPTAYEPSDAVWHSSLDKLFIVSDEGWITMMASDGGEITSWYVGGDLEGIAVADPDSSFIYIGVENPDGILEFNMDTETVTRTFTLTTWMTGVDNQGLEALTFVPDASQTEGGQFYAGHQGEGSVYVFELPIATSTTSTSVTYVTSFTPVSGRTDIAGLSHNTTDDVIYVAYDGTNKLRAIETDGTLVTEWTLPGNDQEGLAIDEDCHLTITEDDATHDVWVY